MNKEKELTRGERIRERKRERDRERKLEKMIVEAMIRAEKRDKPGSWRNERAIYLAMSIYVLKDEIEIDMN